MDNIEDSINEIYCKYYLDVYRFLICFSGTQNDAEDLTQEVFIRVLRNLAKYNQRTTLKTWIFSIAKHVAIDHYRRKKFVTIFKEGFFTQLVSSEKLPYELIEQQKLKETLHQVISTLKPHFRAIIILRGINEFTIKETSKILRCSEAKVKVAYHRALKDLKKKLNIDVEEVVENAKGSRFV